MVAQFDIMLGIAALIGVAGVMFFLARMPGRTHRAAAFQLLTRPTPPDAANDERPADKIRLAEHSVFISYRKRDTVDVVGRLYDHLISELGENAVFKDVDSIRLGRDFREQLETSLNACRVFVCVIGEKWAGPNPDGKRSLDNPEDFLRIEVETALRRGIPLIPLLIGNMLIPAAETLPDSLKDLSYRQGLPLRPDPDFRNDVARLIATILKDAAAPPP